MNPYSVSILISLFFKFVQFLIATFLNIIKIKNANYADIKQNYSYAEFQKACLYTKSKSKSALVRNFLYTVLLLLFWLLSGFNELNILVISFSDNSTIRGILYISILTIIILCADFIYSAYLTFVTESKFGTNSSSFRTFVSDKTKSYTLFFIFFLPILSAVLCLFNYYGGNAWWIAWIILGIVIISIEMFLPKFFLSFFYKTTAIDNIELKHKIISLCEKNNFPVNNIFIIDGSKRTRKVNAYFSGFGKIKTIVLYDTILENFNHAEILSIIGHEIGHHKLHHNFYNAVFKIAAVGFVLFFFNYFVVDFRLFSGFFVYSFSYYTGISFYAILLSIADIIFTPIFRYYQRINERNADIFSVQSTNNKEAMISALKKLSVKNLINPLPHPFYVFLYYSQFPIEQRIHDIENAII